MESRELYFIGDELTSTGFKLAGVKGYSISDKNKDEVFRQLKDKKAILILTHSASNLLGDKLEKLKASSLTISIPEKPGEDYTSIKEIIRGTIGFELKGY